MDDILAVLRYAAAVPAPIRLQMRSPTGEVTIHEFPGPYCLIGRGDECDLTISDPSAAFRHAYLQAIGNRIAVVPLPSATGIQWEGLPFKGWFDINHKMTVAGHVIQLADPTWQAPPDLPSPVDFRPRDEQRLEYGMLPEVELELLNTSAKGKMWPINRVITVLGRDESCRITVLDDRVSRAHCAFLLLPTGLWVIDLLGKAGVQIDGQPVKCALLANGSEMQIGPYRFALHYPQVKALLAAAQEPVFEYGREFLTNQNRIMLVETYQNALIVSPVSDSQAVLYQDVYVESSRISDLIKSKYRHLIIDFQQVQILGHHVVEAMNALCRATSGTVSVCNISPDLRSRYENAPLLRIWTNHVSRNDAIQALKVSA